MANGQNSMEGTAVLKVTKVEVSFLNGQLKVDGEIISGDFDAYDECTTIIGSNFETTSKTYVDKYDNNYAFYLDVPDNKWGIKKGDQLTLINKPLTGNESTKKTKETISNLTEAIAIIDEGEDDDAIDKALDTIEAFAEQGNIEAQAYLGKCYFGTKDIGKYDYVKAAEWSRKAADQGHRGAQCAMGDHYNSGNGVTQDYKKAAEWYKKAADQGHDYAKRMFNFLKEKGKI